MSHDQRPQSGLIPPEALVQASYLTGDHPAFVVAWRERTILACNQAAEKVFGYTAEQLRGQSTQALHVSDEDFARFGEASNRAMADGFSAYRCRSFMRRRDGSTFPSEHLVQPLLDAEGFPVAVISVVRDLSAEGPPRAPETPALSLQQLAGHLTGAVFRRLRTTDGRDGFPFIAGDLVQALTLDPDALSRDSSVFLDRVHADDQPDFERIWEFSQRRLTPIDHGMRLRDADEGTRWVRVIAQPQRLDDGSTAWDGVLVDVSAEKYWELEAERLTGRLVNTLESITDALFTLDHDWRFTYVNAQAERVLERSRQELLGQVVWEEFPEAQNTPIEHEYRRAVREGVTIALETYYEPLATWFDIRAYPSDEGLTVYFRDVTAHRQMMERLQEQEERLRESRDQLEALLETRQALINSLPAHIALLDEQGVIIDVNDRWRHFGHSNDYAEPNVGVGLNYLAVCRDAAGDCAPDAHRAAAGLQQVLAGERDGFTLEYPCHSPTEYRWFRMMANRLPADVSGNRQAGAVVMHVDITERKLAERQLNQLAYEDPVTGLLNRHGFTQGLARHVEQQGWQPSGMVVMLDVVGQREINAAHGSDVGDQLLAGIGRRLVERMGGSGFVARSGGNEFAVFLPWQPGREPEDQRTLLATAFDGPFVIDGQTIESSARFGYTVLGEHQREPAVLLHEAELALFELGRGSTQRWSAYTSGLEHKARTRIELTRELRKALQEHQFELHFQPKVVLETGELIACEALVRWRHPERGLQSPALFIPAAEQSQLIGPLGDWVLFEVCRYLREWEDAQLDVVRVSVNVSVVQLRLGGFVETVREAIETYQVEPFRLTLEITESVFEQQSELLQNQLKELHDLGVRLSLDDFGTGYSSLLYLQQYPFDEIKIDKGFVAGVLDDRYSQKIVTTVLGIAGALGADAVAEGVESAAVARALVDMGCTIGQGFYYSMPLEAEDFRWLLDRRTALPLGDTVA